VLVGAGPSYLAAPSLKKYLGPERASQITPVKTYLEQGFLVVGRTDSPWCRSIPFWQFYHFLTRDTISDGVYGENERVTSRVELLRMITNQLRQADGGRHQGLDRARQARRLVVLSRISSRLAERRFQT